MAERIVLFGNVSLFGGIIATEQVVGFGPFTLEEFPQKEAELLEALKRRGGFCSFARLRVIGDDPSEACSQVAAELVERLKEIDPQAPACNTCGAIMVRSGSCYKCLNCGSTAGCT